MPIVHQIGQNLTACRFGSPWSEVQDIQRIINAAVHEESSRPNARSVGASWGCKNMPTLTMTSDVQTTTQPRIVVAGKTWKLVQHDTGKHQSACNIVGQDVDILVEA
jgi:hypothetical protein